MSYVKDIEIGDTTYTKQENGSFTAPSTAAAVRADGNGFARKQHLGFRQRKQKKAGNL